MTFIAPPAAHGSRPRATDVCFILITILLSLLVVANMILIFCFSAEPPEESGNRSDGVTDVVVDVVYPDIEERPPEEQQSIFDTWRPLVRKLAHFSEFALLGCLSAWLVCHIARRLPALRRLWRWIITALFCLLYAISDEVHQMFTGRGPAVTDVLIDFAGAVTGILVGFGVARLIRRIAHALASRREATKECAV